uniref:Uncharacterized protein n=1 Tax=Arundo donax TaxID=35708 RepID=A0A0A9CSX5_ARUDO
MAMMRSALGGILRRSGAARLPAGGCRFSTGQGADKLADQTTTFLGKLKALPMYLLKEHWLPLSAREKLVTIERQGKTDFIGGPLCSCCVS